MSKYKKPKVGFLDHVAGKQDKKDPVDEVLKEGAKSTPAPEPKKTKPQTKKPVIKEEVNPSAPGMESYVKATQVNPNSAKGSFDESAVEGYEPPVIEEDKLESDPSKMSAYQKALQESKKRKKGSVQHLGEAADLLGGEAEKPVTQADLRQLKVSLASLGGGGLGDQQVIQLIEDYGFNLTDSDRQSIVDQIVSLEIGTTDSLPEGDVNFYYTSNRADSDFRRQWDLRNTDYLDEGDSDLYFTEARARASIQSIDSALIYDQVTGNLAFNENFEGRYTSKNFDSDFALKTTDSLAEGSENLYYTDSRARSAISSGDSFIIYDSGTGVITFEASVIPEGYTSLDFDSDFLLKNTDSLSEGSENLYYTDSRSRSAISSADSFIQYDSTTGVFTFNESLLPEGYTTLDFDSDFDSAIHVFGGIMDRLDSLDARCDSEDIEIANLKNKVDALDINSAIEVQYDKVLSFDSDVDSVPDGFYAIHFSGGTEYIDVDKIYFNIVDKNSITVPLEILDSNDIIILGDSDGGIARYQIASPGILTTKPSGSEYYRFDVTALIGKGGPADTISTKYYPATDNASLASYDYVDAQDKIIQDQIDSDLPLKYVEVAGDTMTGALNMQANINMGGNRVTGMSDPTVGGHAATKSYVDAGDSNLQAQIDALDSAIDSDHAWAVGKFDDLDSNYVNRDGDTMTGNLSIDSANLEVNYGNITVRGTDKYIRAVDGAKLQSNTLRSVGNSNISISRNGERRLLIGTNSLVADRKIKYNSGYNRDSYTSDLAGTDSYTLMPKWYVDDAIANSSFSVDSDLFVSTSGDSMTGALTIARPEGSIALKINKDDQDRIRVRSNGHINWTGNATDARLNKDGGNFTISLNNNTYMKFDLNQSEIEVNKTLTLAAPDPVINLPSNSDVGELQSNSNRRLYWGQNSVGIDVPLDLNADNALRIIPEDAETRSITFFKNKTVADGANTSSIDLRLVGNTSYNRFRIMGGSNQTTRMVEFRAGGHIEFGTDIAMNGHNITGLADPLNAGHAATKRYVDNYAYSRDSADNKFLVLGSETNTSSSSTKLTFTGGNLGIFGNTGSATGSVFYIRGTDHGSNGTVFRVKGNGSVQAGNSPETAFMATEDNEVITKKYFDANVGGGASGSYILNGATTTLTGHTKIIGTSSNYLNFQAASGVTDGFMVMRNSSGNNIFHVSNTGRIKAQSGRMADHDDEFTTKRYVDSRASGGKTWPGRRFIFRGNTGTNVGNGEFGYGGSYELYLSVEDRDGVRMNEGSDDFYPNVDLILCIYQLSSYTWRRVGFAVYGGLKTDFRSQYWRFKIGSSGWKLGTNSSWSTGTVYAITCSEW